jgi:anti-sigma regulatory factor (Ser/Thr protein kinase)
MKNYRATYPCGYGSVRKARHALIAFAALCGFESDELIDIESAAGEALANAAEHGDRTASAGFSVNATCDDADLVIEIKDHGAGFDADAVVFSVPEPLAVRGHGIYLMRMLMDEVAYSERGTRVRLVKRAT